MSYDLLAGRVDVGLALPQILPQSNEPSQNLADAARTESIQMPVIADLASANLCEVVIITNPSGKVHPAWRLSNSLRAFVNVASCTANMPRKTRSPA